MGSLDQRRPACDGLNPGADASLMTKTLVIAEKPSVGAEYARALGSNFEHGEGFLESDTHVVSWAVGHLVGLAGPDAYDPRLKRWSMQTLPILPVEFLLQPDPRGEKQLIILQGLVNRHDVDEIVNGCDAGREGELIFAYIMEWTRSSKPVRRLWVSSMTRTAIKHGFERVRDGCGLAHLREAARSRSEADWLGRHEWHACRNGSLPCSGWCGLPRPRANADAGADCPARRRN
jgi:DNA topoisomerase-3